MESGLPPVRLPLPPGYFLTRKTPNFEPVLIASCNLCQYLLIQSQDSRAPGMKTHNLHSWNLSPERARAIQKNLRAWVVTEGDCPPPAMVGRISIAVGKEAQQPTSLQACVTIHSFPQLQLLERKVALKSSRFPRQAGLLSFRTVPAIIAALSKLNRVPDLFVCDGRGITGPDTFGVASHVGLVTNIPTIGVRPIKPSRVPAGLGPDRGSWVQVLDQGQLAAAVRLVTGADPLLVSPAHRVGLTAAVARLLDIIPAGLSVCKYSQAVFPEAGHNASQPVSLRLIKGAAGR